MGAIDTSLNPWPGPSAGPAAAAAAGSSATNHIGVAAPSIELSDSEADDNEVFDLEIECHPAATVAAAAAHQQQGEHVTRTILQYSNGDVYEVRGAS